MSLPIEQMLKDVAAAERNMEKTGWHNPVIGDLCCHVKALAAEVERLNAAEHQQKRADDLARHFEDFVEFAATCRRENTYEWMVMMLEELNKACKRLDPDYWFRLIGADHFEVMHTPRQKSSEPTPAE